MRYCESCGRGLDPLEPYVVTPNAVPGLDPSIECTDCAALLSCVECAETITPDEGGVHRSCERRVPCTKCSLPIDLDEVAIHEGCLEPCPDCDDEETPTDAAS